MFIRNIPLYTDIEKDSNLIVKSKYKGTDIENAINSILDKYQDKCKYAININDSCYYVSFNVGLNQLDAMIGTMFSIYIYVNSENLGIVKLVNEKEEHPEWIEIKNNLIKGLK